MFFGIRGGAVTRAASKHDFCKVYSNNIEEVSVVTPLIGLQYFSVVSVHTVPDRSPRILPTADREIHMYAIYIYINM